MKTSNPQVFGKYLLLDRIAMGGMAELYLAKITGVQGFEKMIAIKKILPHLCSEESLVEAFIQEAKLAAFLQHQNIIQIYDFGSMDGSYFIAMEYLSGKDLRDVDNKSTELMLPLSLENVIYAVSKLCVGLDYAHNLKDFYGKTLNIIHRDIGPQNIFVTYEGQVKIIDFGIAKAASRDTTTRRGLIKGKVAYMSPEQAEGKAIDYRSDIFAVGILLYEMATRKRMFAGDTFEVLAKVRNVEYEPPEKVAGDLPVELVKIIHKALEKDPEARYQSCGDMLADLEECISLLSFRPSASGLSQYMKELFEQEAADEEGFIRRGALIEPAGESRGWKGIFNREKKEERTLTTLHPRESTWQINKSRAFLAPVVAILVIIGVVGIITFMWDPVSKLYRGATDIVEQHSDTNRPHETIRLESTDESPAEVASRPLLPPSPGPPEIEIRAPDLIRMGEGKALLAAGHFKEATALFAYIVENNASMAGEVSGLYASALAGFASEIMKSDVEKAEDLLLKSVELNPESVQGYFKLGMLYAGKKDYPKAIDLYKKVAALDPLLPDTFFNLGFIYVQIKDYNKAQEMYKRVIEMAPPFLDEAFFNLAMVLDKQGKRRASIACLKKATKVNPENKVAMKYLRKLEGKAGKDL